MTTTTHPSAVTIKRRELPPLPVPNPALGKLAQLDRFDTYAVIRCGEVYAQIERFAYWDETYGHAPVEVTYESRIFGLQEHGGTCDVYAFETGQMLDLAQIAFHRAMLLDEARQLEQGSR